MELFQEVIEYLAELATPVVQAGFELAVKQVYVKLAQNAITFVITTLLFILMTSLFNKMYKRLRELYTLRQEENGRAYNSTYKSDIDNREFGLAGTGLAIFALGITMTINLINIASYAINPQWYALQLILNAISGGS